MVLETRSLLYPSEIIVIHGQKSMPGMWAKIKIMVFHCMIIGVVFVCFVLFSPKNCLQGVTKKKESIKNRPDGRHSSLVVSSLDSELKGPGSSPV